MKIAIHNRQGSYSEYWIEYCKQYNIQYKIVDAYAHDILEQLADCDAFMWHHHLNEYKDFLFAKQLIYIIENHTDKVIYPNTATCWHYDDKIGQHYQFEAIGMPTIPTYIFYRRNEALQWAEHANFPKIFKLRCGASSVNVMLVKNKLQAKKLIDKAFSRGIKIYRIKDRWKELWRKYKIGEASRSALKFFIKRCIFNRYQAEYYLFRKREKGYVYFQDFMPNNDFDTRVFIIGNRAVAKIRMNKKNDFRASGSDNQIFDKKAVDIRCVEIAFNLNKKLKMQSVAFDFLYDANRNPVIAEISYCSGKRNKDYPGYWTNDMQWHECNNINICDWIIEDLISEIKKK